MTVSMTESEAKIYGLENELKRINEKSSSKLIYEADDYDSGLNPSEWILVDDIKQYSHFMITFYLSENNYINYSFPVHKSTKEREIDIFIKEIRNGYNYWSTIYLEVKNEGENAQIRAMEDPSFGWIGDETLNLKIFSLIAVY